MARLSDARNPATCRFGECDGSGWILGPEDIARPCRCREQRIANARLRGVASVIPAKYRGVSFDRPPVTHIDRGVVSAVRSYCDSLEQNLSEGRSLWLFGSPGTGKTTLAMLVSKTALEASRSVAIYSLPKLLARIRQTYEAQTGEQSYAELFERLTSVDLLHIDDLGVEHRTEWVLEQLYALINERYETQRSVIVTTNREIGELEREIGDRIVSRLTEMCGDLGPLPLYAEDRRQRLSVAGGALDEPLPGGAAGGSAGGGLGPLDH